MAIKENALPVGTTSGSGTYIRTVSSGGESQKTPFDIVKGAVTEDMDVALENEVSAREDADTALRGEITDAVAAEATARNQAIAAAIATEVTDRNAAIVSAIDDEETARNTAISEAVEAEAQAREAADEELNQSKANTDGNYPDMTVGNADQLISSIYTEDQTPYNFRQSGGGLSIGDREIDKIVGGTVAWNQLCNGSSVTVQNGRKYLLKKGTAWSIGASTGTAITGLTNGSDMVIDLTAMFGTTIADYIYSLEQATAGAGVAYFRKLFPKPYYAYNAGELMSVQAASHDMVGFNQWDEETELGSLDNDTGKPIATSNSLRSKNFIKVLPDMTYHVVLTNPPAGGSTITRWFIYDGDKNLINKTALVNEINITMPSNARYVKFKITNAYGTTYSHDICINLSDASLNGTYKPYTKHSYPLDSTLTLRGIPKLDNGKLYYDGDRYNADGSVDRRYREVDLSSFSWNTRYTGSTNKTLSVDMTGYAYKTVNGVPNMMGAPYSRIESVGGVAALNDPDNKSVGIYSYTQSMSGTAAYSTIYIVLPKDDSPSGKLVYELATPTTETADPYTNPQTVSDWGTEEYVDAAVQEGDRDVAVPVGHATKYPENLRSKLEDLPAIPEAPSTNGTYTLQAVRTASGVTYSWVSE